MNIIHHLFNEQYVRQLFKERLLPRYDDFVAVKKIDIKPVKKYVWEKTYHVVIEYKTSLLTRDHKIKRLPIYCTAHSDEPRKNVYSALKFLWDHGFAKSRLTIPHPLFYSNRFRATFYRGVKGKNLYQFIRDKNYSEIETIIPQAAAWFAKLHRLPTAGAKNFNKINSRIATTLPGIKHTLLRVQQSYPNYYQAFREIFRRLNDQEKEFFASTGQRWLIHGDAHPENIIKMGRKKIAVIDFTDICLADFARDLGAFLQQLEFMAQRKITDVAYIEKLKTLFLENYLANAKIKLDQDLTERITNYYHWTILRTAGFFLLKDQCEPERAHGLLVKICQDMKLEYKI